MRYSNVLVLLVLVGAGLLVTGPAMAYNLFSGDNNCDQCHDGFDSYGAADHQAHIDNFACNACHVDNGDNPLISTCAVCHDANLLWNYHLQYAPDDLNGMDCAACHTVTATERETWDSIKSRYRDALFSN